MTRRRRRPRRGFTLVEVLVVVIIIGVLAALVAPRFFGRIGKAKQGVAKQKLQAIQQAIELFRYDYGRFPEALDELVYRPDDVPEENWSDPSIKPKDLKDPWEQPFQYRYPGEHDKYDVWSYGADGQEGGTGEEADVVSW